MIFPILKIMFALSLFCLCLSGGYAKAAPSPAAIILDTDIGNDIDDALAVAMAHGLANRGECQILGIVISKDNQYAAEYTSVLNTFYGRPDIPIGLVDNGVTPEDGKYIRTIAAQKNSDGQFLYPRRISLDHPPVPALVLLRKILVKQPDRSVVLVMTGFSTNMARLLQSGMDEYSELSGRELVLSKVRQICMMAGDFSQASLDDPERAIAEYNIRQDIQSAKYFIDNCPVPILFSGFEVGREILYPAESMQKDFSFVENHPLAAAYQCYKKMPYDRPCWDLTALFIAARPSEPYFQLSSRGTVTVRDDGKVSFSADDHGLHRYVVLCNDQKETVKDLFVELVKYADWRP